MLIFFNLIGAGIVIVALAIACLAGYLFNAKTGAPLVAMGLVAMGLDLLWRWKVREGAWFHPRRGGHISFIPVWILGLGMCASGVFGWDMPFNWRDPEHFIQQSNSSSQLEPPTGNPSAPQEYTGLKLNMVSGSGVYGLAMINGQNFGMGESHRLRIAQKTVVVTCVEIHPQSVLTRIDRDPRLVELKVGESTPLAMAQ